MPCSCFLQSSKTGTLSTLFGSIVAQVDPIGKRAGDEKRNTLYY